MANLLDISAFLEYEKENIPFSLKITQPIKSSDSEDYYCCIHAPFLFEGVKKVFGIDKAQASELSIQFVRNLLAGKKIVKVDGGIIDI